MSQSETFWQITRHDYTKIMLLLETSEQRLDGLRSPRPKEARATLRQAAEYLRKHVEWYDPPKIGRIAQKDLARLVWAIDYASGYLENLLSEQAAGTRREIEHEIKPCLDRITWQGEPAPMDGVGVG